MPYKFLPHEADVAIEASGDTLEEAFEEGAKGLFEVMTDVGKCKPDIMVSAHSVAEDLPTLFAEWLNEFIAMKDIDSLFLCKFKVKVLKHEEGRWMLAGDAWGEHIDRNHHKVKTDVKAATYGGLKYEVKNGKHIFTCILDV